MAHPKLRFSDGVEIELLEVGEPPGMDKGDRQLRVAVEADGFTGEYDQVWIAAAKWANFVSELRTLELMRKGSARVRSISPDEFDLELRIIDQAGHLVARGSLSRYHFGRPSGQTERSCIQYSVPLDPSLLRQIVGELSSW